MRSSVIGARDDCTRRQWSGGALHCRSDPIWMLQRNGADCRATTAEEGAKRTRFFGRSDDAGKKRHQFCAKRLMNEIDECALQTFVIF
ncbi:MAG TPA: hypothetical protein VEU75_01290 [Candidatus Acidoferrum sp.]|nr:hypothetical protein [Candidatus Acidoferrum sp.]